MHKLFDCISTPLKRFLACLTFHREEIRLRHLHKRKNTDSTTGDGIRESYPDSYEVKRLEMERKQEIYSKNFEKRRLKKWKTLTESNSTFSKEIKEVELDESKNVIYNNTSVERNSHEDSLSVEESTNKTRFITDNCV